MADPNLPNRGVTLVKLLGILVVTGVLGAGVLLPVIGGVGITGKSEADRFLSTDCTLNESPPATKTTMLANDGATVIAQFFAENRTPVALTQIPTFMQKALIDTEDRRFYDHHGVDARGLLRAAVSNSESGDTQGGSTLTMQYVKQLRYYNATNDAERAAAIEQTVDRKIQDAKCALDLEKRENKDTILANYFNIAFFGQNSYGVQAAANTYFSKDVKDLTLPEAAMIVGLVQAPSQYDPFGEDPQAAVDRRNVVLDNMQVAGDATAAEVTAAKATPLGLSATTPPPVAMGCAYANAAVANAGFFCDFAEEWLANHGISEQTLLRGGLTITTTLDAGLQTGGQNAVWSGDSGTQGGAFRADSASSLVMPSVDPRTGNVLSMITSRRYTNPNDPNAPNDPDQTSVRLFTTAAAGAGSTYKYFSTLAALTAGANPLLTLNAGAPYTTKNCPKYYENGQLKTYVANNAGSYAPVLPLDKALYESSNTYFVGLEDMFFNCNTRPIADMAVNLGMSSLSPKVDAGELDQVATFTLGQESTSPLQLTEAYATIANDGIWCPSNAVLSIVDQAGKPVEFTKDQCRQVVSPQVARTVVSYLVKDTDTSGGTARSVFGSWYGDGGSKVASKTGTNNATGADGTDNGSNSAIWFVGISPQLASAAAVFNFAAPTKTISGLPGYPDRYAAGDAFGAAAGRYWLKAYGPALLANPWTWPSASSVSGNTVPSVTGKSPAEATAILTAAGYQANILPYTCGSSQRSGTLIGYSPTKADPGATITACVSNGKAPSGTASPTGGTTTRPRTTAPAAPGVPGVPAPGGTSVNDSGRPAGG